MGSERYFLTHRTFCYQIWCGDAASWARVMRTFCCSCYLHGQGHSKGSYDLDMTLLCYLNCWFLGNQTWSDDPSSEARVSYEKKMDYSIHVKVTAKDYKIKKWLITFELLILWIALLLSRSKSQERFKIPVDVHLDNISSTAEPFVTKLGMVMHHHGPECHTGRLVCCLQVQSHSGG